MNAGRSRTRADRPQGRAPRAGTAKPGAAKTGTPKPHVPETGTPNPRAPETSTPNPRAPQTSASAAGVSTVGAVLAHFPKELLDSTGFLLALVGGAVKSAWAGALEQTGYNLYHFRVLVLLDEGASDTQAAIADALELDRSQLVGLLDTLETAELVKRHRDPNDRRRHVVSLTPAGRRRLAKFRDIAQRVEDRVLAPLDAGSRAELHELLRTLAVFNDPRCAVAEGSCGP